MMRNKRIKVYDENINDENTLHFKCNDGRDVLAILEDAIVCGAAFTFYRDYSLNGSFLVIYPATIEDKILITLANTVEGLEPFKL